MGDLPHVGGVPRCDVMPSAIDLSSPEITKLLQRIRAEYQEMPGLCLTLRQAQRLWGLDERRAQAVFTALYRAGFLHLTKNDSFVRGSDVDVAHTADGAALVKSGAAGVR
jgi:hypothetical protein